MPTGNVCSGSATQERTWHAAAACLIGVMEASRPRFAVSRLISAKPRTNPHLIAEASLHLAVDARQLLLVNQSLISGPRTPPSLLWAQLAAAHAVVPGQAREPNACVQTGQVSYAVGYQRTVVVEL